MEPCRLDAFEEWFDAYTGRFFGDDEYVNRHLRLKRAHTRRTRAEIVALAERLGFDANRRRLAETVALFHDIGRFPQFARYRTYNDARSVDHSRLGVAVLRRENVLAPLPSEERLCVETAIAHHNRKSLPPDLNGAALPFAKLIRDADKLDIFRIIVETYRRRRDDPDAFSFEIELPDEPRLSPAVLDAVMAGRLVEYAQLRTLSDMRLCQIGWVYDLNFPASLERLREQGFLDRLFDELPQTPEAAKVRRRIREYLAERLSPTSDYTDFG